MGEDTGVTFMQGVEGASTLVLDALLQVSGAKAAIGDNQYLGTVTGGMLGGGHQQQTPSSSSAQATARRVMHKPIHTSQYVLTTILPSAIILLIHFSSSCLIAVVCPGLPSAQRRGGIRLGRRYSRFVYDAGL
jgi:hypothetical protein